MTIEFRPPRGGEEPQLQALFTESFGDERFTELFFRLGYSPDRCFLAAEGQVLAALHWFDCSLHGRRCAYVYGIAAFEHCRGRGIGSALIRAAMAHLQQSYEVILLVPAEESLFGYYERFGFSAVSTICQETVLSGAPLPVSLIEKMLDIPGFIGLKYTNPNYFMLRELKKLDNGNINVINGPDETCLLGLMMGADGAIGSTYNNMPRTFVALYNAFMAGDIETALKLQYQADDAIAAYLKYNVIACVKAELTRKGFDVGEPNHPLPRLTAAEKEAFIAELDRVFPGME